MGKGITVEPLIIRWAAKASGKSISQISQKFPKFSEWTSAASELSTNELNKLSKELRIPFGYFFLKKPPVEEAGLLQHRTIDQLEYSTPSRELIDTIKAMMRRQSFMREALIEDGCMPLNFVGSASVEEDVQALAKKIRNILKLSDDWNEKGKDTFNLLKKASSQIGILVMQNGVVETNTNRPLNIAEFTAFVLGDEYAPLVFLNAKDSLSGKIVSLCHELVHIWLGIYGLYNQSLDQKETYVNECLEIFCHNVVAELLLPAAIMNQNYNKRIDLYTNVKNLANQFAINDLIICQKIKQANLVSRKEYQSVNKILVEEKQKEQLSMSMKSKQTGGNYYHTQGSRLDLNFVRCVNRKAKEGKLLYSQAYKLVGASGGVYDRLLDYMEEQA